MKKLIMTVAVMACAASVVSAQVYSANIVGYEKATVPANAFFIAGVPFDLGGPATPSSVFGTQLPLGTKLYSFNGSSYNISTYIEDYDASYNLVQVWSPDTLDLSSGSGFWVENTTGSPIEGVVAGDVNLADSVTNSIVSGFQILSYPYPVAVEVQNMGFTPALGDKIYAFNGASYNISTYIEDYDASYNLIQTWSPANLTVAVGQGFWYETTTPQTWVAPRNFTP